MRAGRVTDFRVAPSGREIEERSIFRKKIAVMWNAPKNNPNHETSQNKREKEAQKSECPLMIVWEKHKHERWQIV